MPITEADRQYLKHKNRGGKNNAKGNRYENYYAVFQIALLLNSHHERLDDVYLTTQLSNAFVDDLLIGVEIQTRRIIKSKMLKFCLGIQVI